MGPKAKYCMSSDRHNGNSTLIDAAFGSTTCGLRSEMRSEERAAIEAERDNFKAVMETEKRFARMAEINNSKDRATLERERDESRAILETEKESQNFPDQQTHACTYLHTNADSFPVHYVTGVSFLRRIF
jgi:hypothetical protein